LTLIYNVSFTKVSLLTGWQLLTVAISGFFIAPAARIYGKRPVLLVCSTVGFAGSLWLPYATSYGTLLGGRILQGFGVSAYESISFAFIADLYCVHQRGARIAFMLVPLGAINILCPLLSGVVAERLGIQWVYKIMAIMSGIAYALRLFVCAKTTVDRKQPEHCNFLHA
jgi:MFS family permease